MRLLTIDEPDMVSGGFARNQGTTHRADPPPPPPSSPGDFSDLITVTTDRLSSWFNEIKDFFNTQDRQNNQLPTPSDVGQFARDCENKGGSVHIGWMTTEELVQFGIISGSTNKTNFSYNCVMPK